MTEAILYIAFFFFLYLLIKKIGKSFPLFELTALLYLLQYGIAALLEYKYGDNGSMSVSIESYLPFAVFSCLAFIAGLFVFLPKIDFKRLIINPEMASKLGRIFFIIGVGSSLAMLVLPESLRSIINFFIILKFPGVFALVFSNKRIDKLFIIIVFLDIAVSAILNALLIEFVVFTIFLVMFLNLRYNISLKIKIVFAVIGLLFLTVYQGVKADYRDMVWENEVSVEDRIALLSELITIDSFKEAFNSNIEKNESVLGTIHRVNQGWQTSMVLYQVPSVVPLEGGKALMNDIVSSIMPRFLYPDKRNVNDYERFNYYTGYNLSKGTAMTIGVLGDFYINFGFYTGLLFLFLFGMIFSKIAQWFFYRFVLPNPINLIWLPFLFSYLIRPGNEFYMVLNHLVKALIVFYVVRKLVYPYLVKTIKVTT